MNLRLDQDGVRLFHGRAEDLSATVRLEDVDLLLTDPPWGANSYPGRRPCPTGTRTDSTRFSGGEHGTGRRGHGRAWAPMEGDDRPFDPEPWLGARRVCLWGANHFASGLPVGTWLVWAKRHLHLLGSFLSDAELAWEKGGAGVYMHFQPFPPPSRMAETGSCLHPTQKPESLMRWCIERAGLQPGSLVVDPYCGSGTTLVAARAMGMRAIGIECRAEYVEAAAARLRQGQLPLGVSL